MQNHFIYVLVFTGLLSCQPSSSENNPIPLEGKSIFRVDLTSKKKTENALEQNQSKEKLSNQAQTFSTHNEDRNPSYLSYDEPALKYDLNAETGEQLFLESGTEIYIPERAFLQSNGQPVAGTVQLVFKEWHSLSEIFVSGIPMNYTEKGKKGALSSAGMFEIRANQNGVDLRMNPYAPIVVNVASKRRETDFMNLTLNPKSGKWEALTPSTPPQLKLNISQYTMGFNEEIMHPYFVFLRQESGQPQKAILRFIKWKIDFKTRFVNEISTIAQCKFHEVNMEFSEVQDLLIKTTMDTSCLRTGKYLFDFLNFTPQGQVVLGRGEKQCTLSVKPAPDQGLNEAFYPKFLSSFEPQSPLLKNVQIGTCYSYNGNDFYTNEIPSYLGDLVTRPFVLDGFGIKNIDRFVPSPSQLLVVPMLPKNKNKMDYTYYVADMDSEVIWKMPYKSVLVNRESHYKIWAVGSKDVLVADNLIFSRVKVGTKSIQVNFTPISLKKVLNQLDNEVVMVKANPAR